MNLIDVKSCVTNGALVDFQYYRAGQFYYKTVLGDIFPVPLEEVGDATLNSTDRAALFMRYMKAHNNSISMNSLD